MLEYYDRENDTYEMINLGSERVYVKNDYMTIDVTTDKVIFKDDFTLLGGDFSTLKKINDIDEK